MKNSILYIVGALALLGGGAFLFLKNKKNKDKDKLALAEMQKATIGEAKVGGLTSSATTPEEDSKKLQDAKSIATQLSDLKNQKEGLKTKYATLSASKTGFSKIFSAQIKVKIDDIDKKIETLNFALKGMGYTESNGNIVKIA